VIKLASEVEKKFGMSVAKRRSRLIWEQKIIKRFR